MRNTGKYSGKPFKYFEFCACFEVLNQYRCQKWKRKKNSKEAKEIIE